MSVQMRSRKQNRFLHAIFPKKNTKLVSKKELVWVESEREKTYNVRANFGVISVGREEKKKWKPRHI